eukprot:scaffold7415_cov170-Amphora_coffeaeformis.AAC.6
MMCTDSAAEKPITKSDARRISTKTNQDVPRHGQDSNFLLSLFGQPAPAESEPGYLTRTNGKQPYARRISDAAVVPEHRHIENVKI